MDSTSVWELAHQDGASIFVRRSKKGGDDEDSITFGPFLFTSREQLEGWQGTQGPWDLLHPLKGMTIQAHQVSLEWVIQSVRDGFGSANSDCVLISDMVIPLTVKGAGVADRLRHAAIREPWAAMVQQWGTEGMRTLCADIVAKILTPGTAH